MAARIVQAYVTHFNSNKGFGHAETRDLVSGEWTPIFFRIEKARLINWTEDGFVVTDTPDTKVSPYGRGREPMWLIMQVFEGDRGWKASRWGSRPGPNWAYDYMKTKNFEQYPGGRFEYRADRDDPITISGTIAEITVTPLRLMVRLTDVRRDGDQLDELVLEYPLDNTVRDGFLPRPDGRLCITLRRTGEQLIFAFPARS
jgi:hypothetical protein